MKYIFNLLILIALGGIAGIIYFYSQIKIDISKIVDYNPKLTTHIYDKNGDFVGGKKAMLADAIGAVSCAPLGTSTVTSFAESTVGAERKTKT